MQITGREVGMRVLSCCRRSGLEVDGSSANSGLSAAETIVLPQRAPGAHRSVVRRLTRAAWDARRVAPCKIPVRIPAQNVERVSRRSGSSARFAEWHACKRLQNLPHVHHEPEKVPVRNGFSGLFFGLIAAPVLIIVGGMICLTGLGIVLGIPLIVAGVLAPLIGPLMGVNSLRGTCPWCGGEVSGVGIFDKFSCPKCSQRIVVKKHELLKAE